MVKKAVSLFILSLFVPLLYLNAQSMFPRSEGPAHHAPDREFHMINLGLDFHFIINKKELLGVATEKIVPLKKDYDTVHLNAMDMKINNIKMNGVDLQYKNDGKILSIALGKPYGLDDTLTYSISYSTVPTKGIFFILPDSAYPDRTPEIWSQSESEDAQYWYPCHDYPDDFSTSEVTATVPSGWKVISNGSLKKVTADKKDKTKTFYWVESKPHVVYLNSIIAGKYDEVKDHYGNIPVDYYVEPRYAQYAKEDFFQEPDILKFYSEVTGHQYAWEKMSLTTVTNFTEGGMENVSAITLTDNTIHDKNAEPQGRSTSLIAHETAHQWFGDLLTCRTWADAWLNEGFADYFDILYERHAYGPDEFAYQLMQYHNQVIRADKRERRPTVWNKFHNPDDVFSTYIYPRGASILNMLKGTLGEKSFFKAIKHYVDKFQHQNVDTHDFQNAIKEATGRNLYWFFDEWLYKAGHPVFKVSYNYDKPSHILTMNVAQTQKVDSLTPIYKMPVKIYIETPDQKISKTVWVNDSVNVFKFTVEQKPLMVNFDQGNYLLKGLNFKKSADELVYQLKHDKNVNGRIWAADQLAEDSTEVQSAPLAEALSNDSFWAVRAECAKLLGKYNSGSVEKALVSAVNDKDARVAEAAAKSLSGFKAEDAAKTLKNAFNNKKNYYVRAAAVLSLASADSAGAMPVAEKALKINSFRQVIRSAALDALIKLDSAKAYEAAVKLAEYGQPDAIRLKALTILIRDPYKKDEAVSLLEKYTKDNYWIAQLIAINGLGSLGSKNDIALLKELEKNQSNFRVKEVAARSIKQIEMREKQKKS